MLKLRTLMFGYVCTSLLKKVLPADAQQNSTHQSLCPKVALRRSSQLSQPFLAQEILKLAELLVLRATHMLSWTQGSSVSTKDCLLNVLVIWLKLQDLTLCEQDSAEMPAGSPPGLIRGNHDASSGATTNAFRPSASYDSLRTATSPPCFAISNQRLPCRCESSSSSQRSNPVAFPTNAMTFSLHIHAAQALARPAGASCSRAICAVYTSSNMPSCARSMWKAIQIESEASWS